MPASLQVVQHRRLVQGLASKGSHSCASYKQACLTTAACTALSTTATAAVTATLPGKPTSL